MLEAGVIATFPDVAENVGYPIVYGAGGRRN
jgi:hypothetical protein